MIWRASLRGDNQRGLKTEYRRYIQDPLPQPPGPRSGTIAETSLIIISFGPGIGFKRIRALKLNLTYLHERHFHTSCEGSCNERAAFHASLGTPWIDVESAPTTRVAPTNTYKPQFRYLG